MMNENKTLGQILYEAREKKGLTQAEVAKKAGIEANSYARIERDTQKPKVSTLEGLSKALGIKLTVLTRAWSLK